MGRSKRRIPQQQGSHQVSHQLSQMPILILTEKEKRKNALSPGIPVLADRCREEFLEINRGTASQWDKSALISVISQSSPRGN